MENRTITLFQLDSDRAEWAKFMDEVNKAGFKAGSDYFINPGGAASAGFKVDVAASPKLAASKKKYAVSSFGFESVEAGKNIKESAYVVGEKIKVWMGGNKKMLGEVKKIAFGDGYYMVEVAGNLVSRSLHELEPFVEGKDRVVKSTKKVSSLDEAVEKALDESFLDDAEDPELEDTTGLDTRRTIIKREMGNMSIDDAMGEAMDMYDEAGGNDEFSGYSNCCDEPVYGETDICPACKEHCDVIPEEEEEHPLLDNNELAEEEGDSSEVEAFELYLAGKPSSFKPTPGGHAVEGSLSEGDGLEWIEIKDSSFIKAVAYADDVETMYIRFNYGVYEYYDVPENIFRAFLDSHSMGSFFHTNIKKEFNYALAKKYKKRGEIGFTGATKAFPQGAVKSESERNEEMVGRVFDEDHLSPRDEKVKFILDNAQYLPDSEELLKSYIQDNRDYGTEMLAVLEDQEIDALYATIEDAKNVPSIDDEIEEALDADGEEVDYDDAYQTLRSEIMSEWGYDESDMEDDSCEDEVNREADERFVQRFGIEYSDVSNMGEAVVVEAKETIHEISAEDKKVFESLVKAKGYKFIEAKGTTVEGVANILVEKNGRKSVVTYNDNANQKPWIWEGRNFNFIQEALDSIFLSTKEILAEGEAIEANEIKENSKKVSQLLEQRKFADKTTDLSEGEVARREKRSMEILKKFLGEDLIKRTFDR